MRKNGLIVCLLIALGFAIDCTQANISVADDSSEKLASTTPTATSSVIASTPPASRIDGYRDFKFGMTVSEVVAVATKNCRSFIKEIGPTRVTGSRCYETGNNSENLVLWLWASPGTAGPPVLAYVSNEAAPYSEKELSALKKKVSTNYTVASEMKEDKLKQVVNGQDFPVGDLYAGGQVALVVEWKKFPQKALNIYIRYCPPERVAELHDVFKS